MAAAPGVEKQLVEKLKDVPLFHQTTKKQRKTLARLGKVLDRLSPGKWHHLNRMGLRQRSDLRREKPRIAHHARQ